MQADIQGLVERLELKPSKALMPLYESISNSIDAIAEHGDSHLKHQIKIKLIQENDLAKQGGDELLKVSGFDVIDDGAGFHERNLQSFKQAYSRTKVKLGGKGVGRFTLLKVFSTVNVESVFQVEGSHFKRVFTFSIADEVKDAEKVTPTNESCGTKISVRGMDVKYQPGWPTDPIAIAEKIVTHFLIRFAARSCPPMYLEAPGYPRLSLQNHFDETVQTHIQECNFSVDGREFSIQAYRHIDGRARHELHLCANGREVTTSRLRDLLTELPERLIDSEQRSYALIVLITGEYLDDNANTERTQIAFQTEEEPVIGNALISRNSLNRGIANAIRPLLANDLKATHEEKRLQIEKFVEEAPEYRALTHPRYKEIIEQQIQPGLTSEKLDEALLHVRREVEDQLRKEVKAVSARFDTESFDQYQEKFRAIAEQANEIGKAQLAAYIAHRRTILDLVNNSLKRAQSDKKYPLERVLHKMIFPMGETSRDVFFEQQNLWVIDERLCYHTILTSDKKLKSISGLENTSGKEPDIFAFFYDTPIGVSEPDETSSGGIIIIEFKRPGRDNYDKDPADQIIQRFREINEGNVKNIEGRPINPKNIRYTGYLIADLTPSLHKQVFGRYHLSADGEGYFTTLAGGNGYVEIISYEKLLKDAIRRNRILFEKLGLHKH